MADFVIGSAPVDDPFAPIQQQPQQEDPRTVYHDTATERARWSVGSEAVDDPFTAAPELANPFSRGFMTGLMEQNPDLFGEALEGLSVVTGNETAASAAKSLKSWAGVGPEYKTQSKSMWDIGGVGDAITWAGETIGQGVASTLPSVATGAIGAAAGGATAGPAGAVVGGVSGAVSTSYVLGYGELYKALKDEGVPADRAARIAGAGAVPIAALDAGGVGAMAASALKKQVAKYAATRIAKAMAEGVAEEGLTEAMQEAVKDGVIAAETGKPFLTTENAKGWIESGVAGGLSGGAMAGGGRALGEVSGVTGATAGGPSAPPPAPPAAGTAQAATQPQSPQVVGPITEPITEPLTPEQVAAAFPNLTPEDIASPIDNAILSRGKATLEAVLQPGALDRAREQRMTAEADAANADPNWSEVYDDNDQPIGWVNKKTGRVVIGADPRQKGAANEADTLAEPSVPTASPLDLPAATPPLAQPAEEPITEPAAPAPVQPEGGAALDAAAPRPPTRAGEPAVGRPVAGQDQGAMAGPAGPAQSPRFDVGTEAVDDPFADTPAALRKRADDLEEFAAYSDDGRAARRDIDEAARLRGRADELERAANEAATSPQNDLPEPTQAQKEAGNYKVGRLKIGGMDISIENPKGSERKGVDPDGEEWSVTMPAHYGYVRRTVGADGDHLDVYVGDKPESQKVFVVDQVDAKTGKFDETKSILGTDSAEEAARLYDSGFSDGKGPQRRGAMTEMTLEEFRRWAESGDTRRALSDQLQRPGLTPKSKRASGRLAPIMTAENLGIRTDRAPQASPAAPAANEAAQPSYRVFPADNDTEWRVAQIDGGRFSATLWDLDANQVLDRARIFPNSADAEAYAKGQADKANEIEATPAAGGIRRADVKTDVAVTASGREMPVRYAIVEAGDLIPSQDDEGRANPRYDAALQPRDRERGVSRQQIADIAQNLNPRLLDESAKASDGAPIIAADGTVESGNGRSLAIRQAYARRLPGAEAYRAYLADKGYPIDGFSQPVLVRVREGDMAPAERQAFTREANERDTLAMSATERAVADAAAMTDAVIDLYRGGDIDAAQNRPFVRRFIADVVGKNDQAGMVAADGAMSQEAIRRVSAAMLAKAYGDADLVSAMVENADTNIKAIGGALMDVSATWAKMRAEAKAGTIADGVDITPAVLEAVRLVQRARREGRPLAEYVGQIDVFSGATISPEAEAILRLMFRNDRSWTQPTGRDRFADALRFYAEEARKTTAGENLFGEAPASPREILSVAKGKQNGGQEAEQPKLDLTRGSAPSRGDDAARRESGDGGAQQEPARGERAQARPNGERGEAGAVKPAGYGAENKVFTADAAAKAREVLRNKLRNQASSGLDPEMVQAGITLAGYHIEAGARTFASYSKAMIDDLGEAARPYLRSWFEGVRYYPGFDATGMTSAADIDRGTVEPEAGNPATEQDQGPALALRFRDEFLDGADKLNILKARKIGAEVTGEPITGAGPMAKVLEEQIEAGIVMAAREVVRRGGAAGEIFDRLRAIYERQPLLTTRTSNSMDLQAYSTPAPLAFVASRLAGVRDASVVYEPTAGNGMLLMEATPSSVQAVEIDPKRAAALREIYGTASTTVADATTHTPDETPDVVIANPPFGRRAGERWDISGYKTPEIDHAIAWRALSAMRDDGRAVLILGGKMGTEDERRAGYRADAVRAFFKKLYEAYNVVDHFTVDGKLYSRQGASWPVDVIVIDGRGASPLDMPMKTPPPVLASWDEVKGKLDAVRMDPAGQRRNAGDDLAGRSAVAADDARGLQAEAGGPNQRPDREGRAGRGDATASDRRGERAAADPGRSDRGRGDAGGRVDVAEQPGRNPDAAGAAERLPAGAAEPARRDGGRDAGVVPGEPVSDGDRGQRRVAPRENNETETNYQVRYTPTSRAGFAVGTLVPRNMQTAMRRALDDLSARVGDIDQFVAGRLGYRLGEMLGTQDAPGYFSAEQVDALALAIDNVERGAGFIVGDQTGVGKGRFVAGMLRYAQQAGRVPVFVTKDPGLYADMVRDMRDIGMADISGRIFVTNNDLRGAAAIPLSTEGDAADVLSSLPPAQQKAAVEEMARTGRAPAGFDMVFTTYSQLQYAAGGAGTPRQAAMMAVSPNAMFVLDESHEAGGTAATPNRFKKGGKDGEDEKDANRANFVRDMIRSAQGTVYSSATYAKNPTVMSLYYKTDLALAVKDVNALGDTIRAGGVPLQQVVANMLVEAGQYARRERSFAGVEIRLDQLKTDPAVASRASAILRRMFTVDLEIMQDARAEFIDKAEEIGAKGGKDSAVGETSASSTNFASTMHNLVAQMLLALKADQVAEMAIDLHRAGEKPIIALSNTNEQIIDDFIADNNIEVGGDARINFNTILERYVRRLRRITLKDENGDKTHVFMTDEDIRTFGGPGALKEIRDLEKAVREIDLGNMPASPIDYILDKMEAAGMKVDEITGRGNVLRGGRLARRAATAAAKKSVMNGYNAGRLDGLVINRSGSTGFSMHATNKRGNDGKPRHMILLQPDPNIDIFMQMLGRINRTGQVKLPRYTIAVSDLAVEKRPAASLMRKMSSLNANTTASKRSAISLDVTDFMNAYGDQVVARFLADNPDLSAATGVRVPDKKNIDGIAARFTGRLAILDPKEVSDIYDQIETAYREHIESLDRLGQNALEAKTLDLRAKPVSATVLSQGGEGNSPFTAPALLETVDVRKLGKPMTMDEVAAEVKKEAGEEVGPVARAMQIGKDLRAKIPSMLAKLEERLARARQKEADAKTEKQKENAANAVQTIETQMVQAQQQVDENLLIASGFVGGKPVMVRMFDGEEEVNSVPGIVLGVDISRVKDNPNAASAMAVRIAIADATREVRIPLSMLKGDEPAYRIGDADRVAVEKAFAEGMNEAREQRQIITGNLVSGFSTFKKGQFVVFTDENGNQRQGILMARDFDAKKELDRAPVRFTSSMQVAAFLSGGKNRMVQSEDGVVSVTADGGAFRVAVNIRGGKPYFLLRQARAIVGDFQQRRGEQAMRATARQEQLVQLLDAYTENLGATFQTSAHKDEARAIVGDAAPAPRGKTDLNLANRINALSSEPVGWGSVEGGTVAELAITPEQLAEISAIIKRVSGLDDVRYKDRITINAEDVPGGAAAWGIASGELSVGGVYGRDATGDFIMLALNKPAEGVRRTAYHEAFHRLQRKFLTKGERRALKAEMGRLRSIVAGMVGREQQAAVMSETEIEAEAFAIYATARDAGRTPSLPMRVRAAFARLYRIMRAVRNWLNGVGFQTYEDVFESARAGEMMRRAPSDIGGPAMEPSPMQFSLFGDPTPAIHDVLTERSLSFSQRVREAVSMETMSETLTRFRYGFQDDVIDLKLVQAQIARINGGPLHESENAYLQRELADSRAFAHIERIHETMVAPILARVQDKIAGAKVSVPFLAGSETFSGLDLLNVFMYAQHAPERNAYIAGINPTMPDGGSGMTDGDAGAVLAAVRKAGLTKELEALAAQARRIISYSLDVRRQAGLMTQDQVDAWRSQYQFYVPLRGFEDPSGEAPSMARYGSGANVRGPESKRAFGRQSRAGDVFAHVILQGQEAVIRAERNQIALALHELATMNPNPDFWTVDKVDIKPYWNAKTQQVEYRASRNLSRTEEDHTVYGKMDGAEFRVTFNHANPRARRLAEALRNLRGREAGIIMKLFAPVTRYIASVNTAMNPAFVVTNAFRDIQAAAVNLSQHDVQGMVSATLRHYSRLAASTTGKVARGRMELTPEWKRWFDEFKAEGGQTSWLNVGDVTEIRRRLDHDIAAANKGKGFSALGAVRTFGRIVNDVNSAVENSIRLSAYRAAREAGLSRAQSASIAKNVTVNFNRHGVWGPSINALWAFFNAGMQGTATMITALRSPRVRKIVAGIALFGLSMTIMNMLVSGDDDDGESFYNKIPDHVRQKNIILMLPGTKGKYLSFPMPYGYNVFHAIGRVAAELAFNRKPLDAMADLGTTIIDAFNPMGSGSILNTVAPTVFDPVVDLYTNRDFAGRPIKPDPKAYQPDVPEAQKYWNSVSPVAKGITDALTWLTGGDKVQRGLVDISPETLEYLFGVVGGGAARFYLDVADLPMKVIDPEAKISTADIPIVSKVVGSKAGWVDKSTYYERVGEIEKAKAEVKRYGEAGMPDRAKSHAEAVRNLLKLEGAAKAAEKQMTAIRKARGALYQAHELGRVDSATFRERLSQIKDAEEKIIMRFNGIYNEHIGD